VTLSGIAVFHLAVGRVGAVALRNDLND